MRDEYLLQLHGIINHYDAFQKIAVPLKWAETQTSYCDASQYWREVYLRFYKVDFPKGYLKEHFSEALVQTILTVMAYTEEWDLDFWAEMPYHERLDNLLKAESFYSDYFCFQRLCMEQMTATELINEVRSWFPWAETAEEMQKPRAHIMPDKAKKCCPSSYRQKGYGLVALIPAHLMRIGWQSTMILFYAYPFIAADKIRIMINFNLP